MRAGRQRSLPVDWETAEDEKLRRLLMCPPLDAGVAQVDEPPTEEDQLVIVGL
jgi:hypothetical protein